MSTPLLLSRAHLRPDVPSSTLSAALSALHGARTAAAHRLVWTLFGDDPDRRRDFLWREAQPGTYYLLSSRAPVENGLFRVDPPKTFAPALAPGDRLRFALRANATVSRKLPDSEAGDGVRGHRCDIVMDAIRSIPKGERAGARRQVLPEVAARWLGAQGKKHGFSLARRASPEPWEATDSLDEREDAIDVTGYRVYRLQRSRGRAALRLGVLDLEGTIVVDDPDRFLAAIAHGFGRGKAFGCGLMLIRRA